VSRALSRVALQLWIVLFIVFFGAEVIHLEPGLRVITQVLYGIPLAAWALLRLRGPADRLDWAVLGLLAAYTAVCLLSRDRTESLGTLGLATAFAAWFLLMRRAGDLRGPIVLAISTGLAITLAFNAYLLIGEKIDWFVAVGAAPLEGVVTFPWETVNALPVLVLIAVPFLAWLERGPVRTILAVAVGLSAVIVIPISEGRAGWLGLAVAALVLVALHPATGRLAARMSRGRRAALGLGLTVVGVLVLIAAGPRLIDAIGASGRLLVWEQGLNMAGGSPLAGSGPGVYSWVRLEFPPASADLLAVRLLHSVPLLTLAEGGIVMVIAVAVAAATWAVAAVRNRAEWRPATLFTIAALAGFAAASLLDDFSFLPAVTAAVLALAAWLVPVAPADNSRGWVLPALLGLAAVAAAPSVIGVDVARGAAQDARTSMVNGAYADAVAGFDAATRAHPEDGGYWLGLGMASAYAGDVDGAIGAYERSIRAAPGDPRGYAALAYLGDASERVARLEAAAERTIGDPQDGARLGLALAEQGDIDAATNAWSRAVALRSEILRLLPYEETGVDMRTVAGEALRVIQAEPRPAQYENDVAVWDIQLALDEGGGGGGPAWRAVDAARRGDLDLARGLADEAVAAAPYEARGYQAVAAVAAFACDAGAEEEALALERHALGAWAEPEPEPRARREFVYREASLGPSLPPGGRLTLTLERWPWSLIDRPECNP
jgi:tetratricopeptide (TPR) repeat protein